MTPAWPAGASLLADKVDRLTFQAASILAAPQGGVTLRVVDPHTGMVVAPQLSREEAEALLETLRVTLETNRPDEHAGKVESLHRWRAERQAQPRSESITSTFIRRAGDLPEDTYADRLAVSLGMRDERSCGSKAVG